MELSEFFKTHNKLALALSGGADSAYLLWAGINFGVDIQPYYVKSLFQPQFELDDAKRLCAELGVRLTVIEIDILSEPEIVENVPTRCYYCKRKIFSELKKHAEMDGYGVIADGTNASDEYDERPGMKAIQELGVISPLRMCDISKTDLRELSRKAEVFTWNKPSYSCLATRIKTGEKINPDKLRRIEKGEGILFGMGFSDFRLRTGEDIAKLQVKAAQADMAREKLSDIKHRLSDCFSEVILDSEYR